MKPLNATVVERGMVMQEVEDDTICHAAIGCLEYRIECPHLVELKQLREKLEGVRGQ
ncbi:MAG: hypothetical protein M0P69_08665 [Bacteroidales bacterium]|nr:hypothetical protein [Bacteroidales bacterium]